MEKNWGDTPSATLNTPQLIVWDGCSAHYAFGKRFINIIHTKLRHKCILHHDL